MNIKDIYELSWFSNMAYVGWNDVNSLNKDRMILEAGSDDAQRIPLALGGQIFVRDNWEVTDIHPNDENGFAGNVFDNGDKTILAIRGTEIDASLLPPSIGDQTFLDLLDADIQQIGLVGLAIDQCVSLFNYVQCLQADASDNHVLQLTLHTESVMVGADAPTDRPFIKVYHPSSNPILPGTDEFYWLEPSHDGTGLGVLSAGEHLTVTGHSLGGHLAALAVRLFPGLFDQAVTFNAPGFDPVTSEALTDEFISLFSIYLNSPPAASFADVASRIVRVESEDSAPGDDVSVVSSLFTGVPVGISTIVRTENNSHSMDQMMDALSVMNLMETLSPQTGIDDAVQIYDSISIQSGATEEQLLGALSELFLGDAPTLTTVEAGIISHGDFNARSALHERVLDILAAVDGKEYTFMNLVNLSSAELLDLARDSKAYCYALQELNPFAVLGDDSLYDVHDDGGALDFASFSEDYWEARADFLTLKNEAGLLDQTIIRGGNEPRIYVDDVTGLTLGVDASPGQDSDAARVVFGGNDADSIDLIEGARGDDVMFGGLGSDIVVGHDGADVLEGGEGDDSLFGNDHLDSLSDDGMSDRLIGGSGSDSYYVGNGDEITDSDRIVRGISFQGVEITGEYHKVVDGIYRNDGRGVELVRDDSTATFILETENGASRFNITNFWGPEGIFHDGDFGISLLEDEDAPDFSVPGVIVGTEHPDRYTEFDDDFPPLSGTINGDSVVGLAGGDLIYVYEGHDEVDGGPGSDYISGIELFPNSVGYGDLYFGGAGSDVLVGSRGDDELFGGDDGDFLQGRPGNDFEHGGGGDDFVYGGAGSDRLFGGDGHDIVVGDARKYPYFNPFWDDDGVDAGAETFRINRRYIYEPPLEAGGDKDYLFGGNGDDILLGQDGDDELSGGSGRDVLIGGPGDDFLDGGSGDDNLSGGGGGESSGDYGNDVLHGGDGSDSLGGQGGDDDLSGDAGNDWLAGGTGHDRLSGGGENDHLSGGDDDDVLSGDSGDDVLDGEAGNDVLRGGSGSDVFIFGRDHGADSIVDSGTASPADIDTVVIDGDLGTWDVTLQRSGSDLRISIIDSDDSLIVANWFEHEDRMLDQIEFTSGPTWDVAAIKAVLAGTGTEVSDYYFGTPGNDFFNGFGADDVLYGNAGDDTLMGGNGFDVVVGGDGNDHLFGEGGDDELIGAGGNDILDSGPASDYGDVAFGGEGSDTYIFNLEYRGVHVIRESDGQGNDTDVIRFGAGIAPEDLRIGRPSYQGNADDVLLIDVVPVDIPGGANIAIPGWFSEDGAQIERFEFQNGTFLTSQDIEARLNRAGDGHDYLTGNAANDVIHGFAGNDEIHASGESSHLFGDEGDDYLFAGAVLNDASGGSGDDQLRVVPHYDVHGTAFEQVSLIRGEAGDDELIVEDSFFPGAALLDGGTGQDQLSSSAGARTMYVGGPGNDHIQVNTNDTASLILFNAGDGVDYVEFSGERIFGAGAGPEGSSVAIALSIGGVGISDISLQRNDLDLVVAVGPHDEIVLSDWFGLDPGVDNRVSLLQIITQGSGYYDHDSANPLENSLIHVFDLERLVAEFTASGQSADPGHSWSIAAAAADALIVASDDMALGGQVAYEFGLLGQYENVALPTQIDLIQAAGFPIVGQAIEVVKTAPFTEAPLADHETLEDASFNLSIPSNTFEDPLISGNLNISVSLADGSALPHWLSFDQASLTLRGVPLNGDVGEWRIAVQATNRLGESAADVFTLTVLNTNDAPIFVCDLPDALIQRGSELLLHLPPGVIIDPDRGDELQVAARLVGGAALPEWLRFDNEEMSFSGHVPSDALKAYDIELIATDRNGGTSTERFTLATTDPDEGVWVPTIVGTPGRDRIEGTTANDAIASGDGADVVNGGDGDDTLNGGSGDDVLLGGTGNDDISGEQGNDLLQGGPGSDRLDGGPGADSIEGGLGNDTLFGGIGQDKLSGGAGKDVISGGAGRDTLDGGNGDDTYVFGLHDGRDQIKDSSGKDVLRFDMDVERDDVVFARNGSNLVVGIRGSSSSVTVSGWFTAKSKRIERFEYADGSVLLDSQVQSLIHAMAAFGPAPAFSAVHVPTSFSSSDWSALADNPVQGGAAWNTPSRWLSVADRPGPWRVFTE